MIDSLFDKTLTNTLLFLNIRDFLNALKINKNFKEHINKNKILNIRLVIFQTNKNPIQGKNYAKF